MIGYYNDGWCFKILDWFMGNIFLPLIVVILMGLVFIGIPVIIYEAVTYKPPSTFELRADSWHCAVSHKRSSEVCGAKTGCHWVQDDVCTQWDAN